MDREVKSKSKTKILHRGISELVRRATIGALYPYGPPRRDLRNLPSIQELLDEGEVNVFQTVTETSPDTDTEFVDSDSETTLPIVEVKVPTDGTVRNLEEFISNYNEHSSIGKPFLFVILKIF